MQMQTLDPNGVQTLDLLWFLVKSGIVCSLNEMQRGMQKRKTQNATTWKRKRRMQKCNNATQNVTMQMQRMQQCKNVMQTMQTMHSLHYNANNAFFAL